MAGKLINVRLAAADASKAEALKSKGVELSGLVHNAIRAEYSRRFPRRQTGANLVKTLKELYAQFPIPDSVPRVPVDTTNRKAASQYIRERLEQKMNRIHREAKKRRTP